MATETLNKHTLFPAEGGPVRIGLCTDTHVWPDGQDHIGSEGNLLLLSESARLLDRMVDEFAAHNLNAVIHLGDFTCGGGYFSMPSQEFYAAADMNRNAFDRLPMPGFGLPGNHDCPPGAKNRPWRYVEEQWDLLPGMGLTVDTPYARLILLNAQGHAPDQIVEALPDDPIYGWVSDAELARLDEALASAGGRPVVIFVHQLLRPWISDRPWQDFYLVHNAEAVLDRMAFHGSVRAVFQGHAHMLDVHESTIGNGRCHFIVTPAVVEYPHGWLELAIEAEQLRCRLQLLPEPELRHTTKNSGPGHAWRAGKAAWHDFCIDFT